MEILFTNCYPEAMPCSSARLGSPLSVGSPLEAASSMAGKSAWRNIQLLFIGYLGRVIQTLGIAIGTKAFTRYICPGRQIVKISCCLYRILFRLSFIPKAKV